MPLSGWFSSSRSAGEMTLRRQTAIFLLGGDALLYRGQSLFRLFAPLVCRPDGGYNRNRQLRFLRLYGSFGSSGGSVAVKARHRCVLRLYVSCVRYPAGQPFRNTGLCLFRLYRTCRNLSPRRKIPRGVCLLRLLRHNVRLPRSCYVGG